MENQKVENILNLALDATIEERESSLDLNVGYDEEANTWEIIVKYSGDIEALLVKYNGTNLLNEYAVLRVPESELSVVAQQIEVEYIEKPKRLFYDRNNGRRTSCITAVQQNDTGLYGEGIIVAIIDSGIDYMNREFRDERGDTRISYLWDQSLNGVPPKGYKQGVEYNSQQINEAIQGSSVERRKDLVPSTDFSGHGTEVASVAVGSNGVAPKAEIIVVKLGIAKEDGFPRTIELMEGLNYVVEKSIELKKPIAINMSFGNTYGAHNGSSLLERFIDDMSNYGKSVICVSAGNEGDNAGHISGKLENNVSNTIELAINSRQTGMNVQLWKRYEDKVEIQLISPGGEKLGPFRNTLGTQRYKVGNTEILLYYGEPSPYSVLQEIFIEFIPRNDYVEAGIWTVLMEPINIVTGRYDLWLPSAGVLTDGTNFLRATKEGTITIPATAQRVISVGAYNSLDFTYASFSGRGKEQMVSNIKPDIVGPGVDVIVSSTNSNMRLATGTSFAAPFVTGGAALLMEWGIVKGNDPFLYGEKVKAYLQKGAVKLSGVPVAPNTQEGFGRLCVENSIPN